MKRYVILTLFLVFLHSCGHIHSGASRFDFDNALNSPPRLSELCTKITLIPLENSDAIKNAFADQIILDVTPGYYVVFDKEENDIVIYDKGGRYNGVIQPIDTIIDIASYNNYLDILLRNVVVEYNLERMTLEKRFVLHDYGIAVNRLARRDEDVLLFAGEARGIAYDFEYFIERNKYIVMESPLYHADDYRDGRFFQCNDSTFFFHSTNGDIVYNSCDDFLIPVYQWNIEKPIMKKTAPFSNVQKTKNNLYRLFSYRGENCVLITHLHEGIEKYSVISKTSDGFIFPLGVIRNDINYYYCHSSRLSLFLHPDMLDSEDQLKYAECTKKQCNVIISYTL